MVVSKEHTSFLDTKLKWLEVCPKVIALAETEENAKICPVLEQITDSSDEG